MEGVDLRGAARDERAAEIRRAGSGDVDALGQVAGERDLLAVRQGLRLGNRLGRVARRAARCADAEDLDAHGLRLLLALRRDPDEQRVAGRDADDGSARARGVLRGRRGHGEDGDRDQRRKQHDDPGNSAQKRALRARTLHGPPVGTNPPFGWTWSGTWNSPRAGLRFGASKEARADSAAELRERFAETFAVKGRVSCAKPRVSPAALAVAPNAYEARRLVRGDRGHRCRGRADGRERDAVGRPGQATPSGICRPSRRRSSTAASAACRSSAGRSRARHPEAARRGDRSSSRRVQDKTTLPGAVEPAAAATEPNAPAPAPGRRRPFAGTLRRPRLGATWAPAGRPTRTATSARRTSSRRSTRRSASSGRRDGVARGGVHVRLAVVVPARERSCDNDNGGDPTVTYDPIGDRWFVADFAFTGSGSAPPYYECIAVSRTGDPVDGGWYFYAIRADDAAHPWFPDYPKMGIWPDGLYMTANMFQGSTSARFAAGRSTAPTWKPALPVRTVVFDTNTTTYFSLLPSNMRTVAGAPPAGRAELLRRRVADRLRARRSSSSTSTGRAAARPSPGRRTSRHASYTVARGDGSEPGEQPRHAARAPDELGAVHEHQRRRVAVGEPHRSAAAARRTARPGSSGSRSTSPAATSPRRRCSSRSTPARATGCTAGWAASPSTSSATWRSATASRARR